MHGVKQVRYSREALAAKKERERAKLKEYQSLTAEVLARKAQNYDSESFGLTTKLLQINPEFYTVWNYRRTILLDGLFPQRTAAEINDLLSDDLSLTTALLKQHPKVYAIWTHRQWCLQQVPDGPTETDPHGWRQAYWNKELFVVERMLDADPRNCRGYSLIHGRVLTSDTIHIVHAWNYRRYVLAEMPVKRSEASELAYTKRKIEANFSNFSAWHQRSKVLASLWAAGKLDRKKSLEEEFDLVKNAMYTEPNDQSVWIYHRWLIGPGDDKDIVEREVTSIQELLEEQPDSKWCMESLVFYNGLLLRRYRDLFPAERRQELGRECLELLRKLQDLDPDRKQRYIDLSRDSLYASH
ncbi:rab-protein geranylgeranyltransferase [Trametes cingulata]|nr:rab-protein geranylgeranyltransferase [Trametes cingulata]